jgi:hypothetical protein
LIAFFVGRCGGVEGCFYLKQHLCIYWIKIIIKNESENAFLKAPTIFYMVVLENYYRKIKFPYIYII